MNAFKISANKDAVKNLVDILEIELVNTSIEDKEEDKYLVEISNIIQQLRDQLEK